MSWQMVDMERLIDDGLIKLGRGKVISKKDIAATPGEFPIYSSARLSDGKFGEYGKYMFDEELITWSVDGGGSFFYRPRHKFSVTNVGGTLQILDLDRVDYKYLYYVLSYKHGRLKFDWISKAHPSVIRRLYTQIPLPSLDEQKRIAAILDKADAIRRKHQQAIEFTDQLLCSVFLDMFGDPLANPKGWDVVPLEKVCVDIYRYPTFYGFKYVEQGVPVVKIGNITKEGYVNPDLSKYDFVTEEVSNKYPRTILKLCDILMAVRGDGSTGKRIGMLESDNIVGGNISPNLIMFRANQEKINPIFLYFYLVSKGGQKLIEKYITKTAKKTIKGSDLKKINIFYPSLEMQQHFSDLYVQLKKENQKHCIQKDKSKDLFLSLSQKFFNSDLTKQTKAA